MFQVTSNICINLFVNLVAQLLHNVFSPTEPDRGKVVYLHGPDFVIPYWMSPQYRTRCTVISSLGSERTEYLLYDITAPQSILDAFQGEFFESGNIVLARPNQNFLGERRNSRDLIGESID
jgi:hypothetical protein